MGQRLFTAWLGALSVALHAWDLLKEVAIIFVTSTIVYVPMDCSLPGSSVHGIFPGNSTGVDCHFLLQGIFLTQGSNPGLPHCRQTLNRLSHQGSHSTTVWPKVKNREGTQPHPSTEYWIKDLLSMALPIRTRPSFPLNQALPSGSSRKPLSFSIRADRLKTSVSGD